MSVTDPIVCVVWYILLYCSTDIDECQLESDSCASNADCFDTEDSYMCMCSNGFTGDGLISCDSELLITASISECCIHVVCSLIRY